MPCSVSSVCTRVCAAATGGLTLFLPARKATPPSSAVPAESPAPPPTSSPEKALPAFCLYAAPLPDTSRNGTVRRLSLWAGFFTQRGVSQACLRDRRPVTSSCHSSSRLSGGPR